nr:Lys-gingipain form 2=17 kda lysine-specific cysteine proteinase {N-terminal} [Porphyromonas gingivalis, H66, Peptide Partial, 16 aa] [Porphyromonas gingivalis]
PQFTEIFRQVDLPAGT